MDTSSKNNPVNKMGKFLEDGIRSRVIHVVPSIPGLEKSKFRIVATPSSLLSSSELSSI
jgi:hypothetical protein